MKPRASAKSLLLLFIPFLLSSQPAASQSIPADSSKSDSLHRIRSDTLRQPLVSIPLLGSVDRSLAPGLVIDDSIRRFAGYETLSDLLVLMPGYFTFSLGSPGTFQNMTSKGLGSGYVAVLSDGIALNEPYTGTLDISSIPLEDIGRIEVIPDTRSFLYGLNGTGSTINLVDASRRAVHPYSHIRYSEDGYEYSLVDGMISEDIIRGLNVTAGAQHTTAGGRFPNSDFDAWSGRARIRYDLDGGVSLFASETYSQTRLDLNGGIDSTTPDNLAYDRFQATVRNTDSYEKRTRHDLRLGVAVDTKADSNAVHQLTFYYSNSLREYRDEENRPGSNGIFYQQDQESRWYGVLAGEHRKLPGSVLDLGAEIQCSFTHAGPPGFDVGAQPRETRYDVFGILSIAPRELLHGSVYGRFDHNKGQDLASFGGDATLALDEWLAAFGGASLSHRFPTVQEVDGASLLIAPSGTPGAERHRLVEAGIRSSAAGLFRFEAKAFHRSIDDPTVIVAQSPVISPFPYAFARAGSLTLRGFDGSFSLRLGSIYLEGTSLYINVPGAGQGDLDFPSWTGSGGIYFWDYLSGGHLYLKLGVRGSFFNGYQGRKFDVPDQIDVPASVPFFIEPAGTADLVLIARLGNAYVHFLWENLTDRQYIMRIFYPMPDRSITFGISWDFLD